MKNDITICVFCNKEYTSISKNQKYCSPQCKRKSNAVNYIISVPCVNCDITVMRNKFDIYNNVFCCFDCEKEYKYKQKNEIRICEICKESFSCLKSSSKRFCNTVCQGKWQSTLLGDNNVRYKKKLIKCNYCEKEYYERNYKIENDKYKNHFCCEDCSRKWYAEIWSQTEEWKEESRIRASKFLSDGLMPNNNTKPQQIIDSLLKDLHIDSENEYNCKYYTMDNALFVNNSILFIEIMGTYWHCDSRVYDKISYSMQKNRVIKDKSKHTYIFQNSKVEILYLWEKDIYEQVNMCKQLILKYIKNKGILDNYHSCNYGLIDGYLTLNQSIISPYMEWDAISINNITDLKVKERSSKKQKDKWIVFECDFCKQKHEQLISKYNKNNHHYCSILCKNKAIHSKPH